MKRRCVWVSAARRFLQGRGFLCCALACVSIGAVVLPAYARPARASAPSGIQVPAFVIKPGPAPKPAPLIFSDPVRSAEDGGTLHSDAGDIIKIRAADGGAEYLSYSLPMLSGAEFELVTLHGGAGFSLNLGSEKPYFFIAEPDGTERALSAGALPNAPFFVRAEGGEWLVMPPTAYRGAESGCVELTGERAALRLIHSGGTWSLEADYSGENEACMWYLSAESLAGADGYAWYNSCSVGMFDSSHLLLSGGYFYITSANHIPHSDKLYYRIAAPHIGVKLAWNGGTPAAALAVCVLDVCRADAETSGRVLTQVGVDWLNRDYGITPGFYDTRFNTDYAGALLELGKRLGIPEFRASANRFAAYLVTHISDSSRDADGLTFSPDYGGGASVTHTSLNHQAAEALLLYRAGFAFTADRLVRAIELTAQEWLAPSGDLWYARSADGVYFGVDYPFLTYNDLYDLQLELETRGGRSAVIDALMACKRAWMDSNGVTGYKK